MIYVSTRNLKERVSGAQAIVNGIAPDGGLYVPLDIPQLSNQERASLADMDYAERAAFVIGKFLPELKDVLGEFCAKAYGRFDGDPAPVVKLDDKLFLLELWHGPTHAFKDMALTLLPYLLTASKKTLGKEEKTLILVATSGDTGKAALEGFKDVEGTACMVFYPNDGVSDLQKLQMMTQRGSNVFVSAIDGNFDDAQTAVKKIFTDAEIKDKLSAKGYNLSSANSINWGRLVPQIAYYFSAYTDLVTGGVIKDGDKVNFTVPTGNFGNILAGYYAKRMGLPIGKLVCASNQNNVLTDFFDSGCYDANREFYKTISPSMDILVSSNLERLIFEMSGRDDKLTAQRMDLLKKKGRYEISDKERSLMGQDFFAAYADEDAVRDTIYDFFEENGYILDPHSAVAANAADGYMVRDGQTPMVVVCTASPYKFVKDVLKSIDVKVPSDELKAMNKLQDETALPLPDSLKELPGLKKRFVGSIDKTAIADCVLEFVKG